jgi:Fur family zinc uptake transcriptional regulator
MDWVTGHLPPASHDHRGCVLAVLAAAERRCADRRLRLTAQRRRVLEIVAGSHRAIGAYDILATLAAAGHRVAPIAVYRALDFLVGAGLVHRLASHNAYVACGRSTDGAAGAGHRAQLLICRGCRAIAEVDDPALAAAVDAGARAAGFSVTADVIEIAGLCADCAGRGAGGGAQPPKE